MENQTTTTPTTDAWTMYIYSLKSPVSKQKYPQRLAKFFAFADLPQDISIEEQSKMFVVKATVAVGDTNWAFNTILKFVLAQLERVNRKEIVIATLRGYLKAIKLFCDVAELSIAWKRITRGLPRGRRFADDRAPTIEEIRNLCEYPDRRIKAIVYTMASSGIRLGAWDYLKWGHIKPIIRNEQTIAARMRPSLSRSEIVIELQDVEMGCHLLFTNESRKSKWLC